MGTKTFSILENVDSKEDAKYFLGSNRKLDLPKLLFFPLLDFTLEHKALLAPL